MASQSARSDAERRRSARQKSFLRGQILFNNRRTVVDCLVRDISASGARVIFSDAVSTPDAFELYIPQKEQRLPAYVEWRHGQELGVAFAEPVAATGEREPAAPDLAERVQRLEAEIVALKRMLKRLRAGARDESDAA